MNNLTMAMTLAGFHKEVMPNNLFWNRFFPTQFLSKDEHIVFDKVKEETRVMAKFAMPNVVAPVNGKTGYSTSIFTPAYLKEKDAIEAWDPTLFNRLPGEQISGQFSPEDRAQLVRGALIQKHTNRMENRFNAMCAETLITGKCRIFGDNYPEVTVDFNRSANHTAALTGAQQWGQSGVNPFDAIAEMNDQLWQSTGGTVTDLVFGPGAWREFHSFLTSHPDWFSKLTKGIDLQVSQIQIAGLKQTTYMGSISDTQGYTLALWVDNSDAIDSETGNVTKHMAANDVIGIDVNDFGGVQAFGAIKDKAFGLKPARWFSKEIPVEEPSIDFVLTQSAPLMIPGNTNATWRLTVK